ncbi:MAG: hypothetical protein K6T76_10780 [Alicyclobacillus mali]|uniref:hypothetical protein n=1 Tax=Alicyclobacillus mali (ex Roth et al. 2021) TaxID=1123961 RepID=UPI0023F1893E|nr:hypothetical protein [Alicyclobacillus mali (ex Roth et al. 2021)]MCL6489400.1 hypothetical protein [Alicyclobacillus mali (ex Roth et al. 2021)]
MKFLIKSIKKEKALIKQLKQERTQFSDDTEWLYHVYLRKIECKVRLDSTYSSTPWISLFLTTVGLFLTIAKTINMIPKSFSSAFIWLWLVMFILATLSFWTHRIVRQKLLRLCYTLDYILEHPWSLEFQEHNHFEDAGVDDTEDDDHGEEWGENSPWDDFS